MFSYFFFLIASNLLHSCSSLRENATSEIKDYDRERAEGIEGYGEFGKPEGTAEHMVGILLAKRFCVYRASQKLI